MADVFIWTSNWADYRVVSQARGAVVLVGLPVLALPEDTAVNLVGECSVKPETNLMILLVIGIARGMAGFGCDLVGIDLSRVKMPKVSKCYSEKKMTKKPGTVVGGDRRLDLCSRSTIHKVELRALEIIKC